MVAAPTAADASSAADVAVAGIPIVVGLSTLLAPCYAVGVPAVGVQAVASQLSAALLLASQLPASVLHMLVSLLANSLLAPVLLALFNCKLNAGSTI